MRSLVPSCGEPAAIEAKVSSVLLLLREMYWVSVRVDWGDPLLRPFGCSFPYIDVRFRLVSTL